MTIEQKMQHLWDENEVRKLMSRYIYYSYARTWELVPEMFAKRDDIWIDCEGFGVFDGAKGIETFFVQWHHAMEGDGKGILTLHTLTTDIIEVSDDGLTAHGLWISPGTETRTAMATGQKEAFWIWGLYAVDFIKEDDEWKFWHFRIPHLFMCDYHRSWPELERMNIPSGSLIYSTGRPTADRPSVSAPTYYRCDKEPSNFYEPPRKYATEAELQDFWKLP